jgi:DNA mismatch endonuclease (patch repair protein)
MPDEVWTSTSEGRHLAGRRKRDTEPELLLRRAIHAQGGRFRVQVRLAKGCTPDIVMPSRRLAIFVDGDYWHSCPEHGRKAPFTGPNAALWEEKFRRNRERDGRSTALAHDLGWQVVRLWECQVRSDPEGEARRLLAVRCV